MKLRNLEFSFNALDADDLQKFEECSKRLSEVTVPEKFTLVESIRYQCSEIDAFFNGILGEDASKKLFTKSGDLGDRVECAAELRKAILDAQNQITKVTDKIGKIKSK